MYSRTGKNCYFQNRLVFLWILKLFQLVKDNIFNVWLLNFFYFHMSLLNTISNYFNRKTSPSRSFFTAKKRCWQMGWGRYLSSKWLTVRHSPSPSPSADHNLHLKDNLAFQLKRRKNKYMCTFFHSMLSIITVMEDTFSLSEALLFFLH